MIIHHMSWKQIMDVLQVDLDASKLNFLGLRWYPIPAWIVALQKSWKPANSWGTNPRIGGQTNITQKGSE